MLANALQSVTIKGFKSIASIENLALRAINVVVGANGSGKSNFIGVFNLLHTNRDGRLHDYVEQAGGAEKILHFGSKLSGEVFVALRFDMGRYSLRLRPTADDGLYMSDEEIKSDNADHGPGVEHVVTNDEEESKYELLRRMLLDNLLGWRVYHFHDTSSSSLMRKTAKINDNRFLRPDGANLAAFLYYLREKHESSYKLVVRTVQRVAPFFSDFRLAPLRLSPDDIKLEWRHKRSDQYFDASSLSDGTLRFIALSTLFLQPEALRPSVILVDEPELGLHPYAVEILASLVRQTSQSTQVILSTESSLLLDHFAPEDVLVADRVEDGTQIKRLEPAKFVDWLKAYSLGQLWEKNEFGGRPVPA